MKIIFYISGFQHRAILRLGGHLAMCGDILIVTTGTLVERLVFLQACSEVEARMMLNVV